MSLAPILLIFLKLFLKFIYFERETERANRGRAERGRDRIPSRLCAVSTKPNVGLEITNCEIMT